MRAWKRSNLFKAFLAASTAIVSIALMSFADAQAAPSGASQLNAIAYDIPAQHLASALAAFAQKSGLKLAYSASLSQGRMAPALTGSYTSSQALSRLLGGSGLTYRFSGRASVTIEAAQRGGGGGGAVNVPGAVTLDTINVQGSGNPLSTMTPMPAYAGGQVATGGTVGMLGNRSVMDTPFNQTNYTSQTIQDQQARTISDVLANDPSVRDYLPANGGNNQYFFRGFPVTQTDFALSGLYGIAPSFSSSTDYVERVEVLKGPSVLLNGMPPGGAIGGSVNLVTKRAGDEPLTQFTTSYVSRGQAGEHVDIDRRFGQDNMFGVRINGTYRNGDTPVDHNKDELGDINIGLDLRTDRARLSADFGYQNEVVWGATRYIAAASTLPFIPPAPNASVNQVPAWNYLKDRDLYGVAQGEFDITDHITAYGAIGAHQNDSPQYGYVDPKINNLNGSFTTASIYNNVRLQNVAAQVGVRSTFDTGPINQAIDFNASSLDSIESDGYISGPTYAGNIYVPQISLDPNLTNPGYPKYDDTRLSSLGISDTFSAFDKRVQATVGVRRQQIDVDVFSTTTGALTSSTDEGVWSPAYAIVVKPLENVSVYANYIQGLQPGTVVGATYANFGQTLPPYVSKQIETGVKIDWGKLTTTFSAFQITQPNAFANTATNTYEQDGQQRNRGLEFNTFGELMPGVRLLGGLTLLDGRQTETQNGTNNGKKAIGVPDYQLNLGAEWDTPFLKGFTVNGRIIYTGSEYLNATNTLSIPDWTRIDLGARYTFVGPWNKPVTIRLNVENALNKNYWASAATGYLIVGAPRTFLLSTTMSF